MEGNFSWGYRNVDKKNLLISTSRYHLSIGMDSLQDEENFLTFFPIQIQENLIYVYFFYSCWVKLNIHLLGVYLKVFSDLKRH